MRPSEVFRFRAGYRKIHIISVIIRVTSILPLKVSANRSAITLGVPHGIRIPFEVPMTAHQGAILTIHPVPGLIFISPNG